ncbi:four-carbon acid sugar kinase family protein [Dyadobacter tibetensis]|uniref:four-carbon acid sugar kinase family protein n=1 Tax=Dyadobacter tibetensis TaxID=1211851 RepID=UPI0004715EE4|nr:four-carbon acid sugar kinase family protein [Dyadobacter tibetensis]
MSFTRTIIVLDDDPTGTQTVHHIPVLTGWSDREIQEEYERGTALFFILTNSRAFSLSEAKKINYDIGRVIANLPGPTWIISRGDSTLRGHFPGETDALSEGLGWGTDFLYVLIPAFFEGKRFTHQDIHYLIEGGEWVPVGETPYARDLSFGFKSSNLRDWVMEKSQGSIGPDQIHSLRVEDLEAMNLEEIRERILETPALLIVNALGPKHLDRFVEAAEGCDRRIIFRTAASFVASAGHISQQELLTSKDLKAEIKGNGGGLVVVGSHVPKTNAQLKVLLKTDIIGVEFEVIKYFNHPHTYLTDIVHKVEKHLKSGMHVVLYTSRTVLAGSDEQDSLHVSTKISEGLVAVVANLATHPSFLIAKGGITSSDIATKALSIKRALVLGQLLPGVPVWEADATSRFPGLQYVIFPGNVGEEDSLFQAYQKIRND